MKQKILSYKELIVWQKSMELVTYIYSITKQLPKEEVYGLSSQMRRAAVSIPSNIAEGRKGSKKEFRNYLRISYGSALELETQIEIACRLDYINKDATSEISNLLCEVLKMLNKMLNNLKE